jgi:chemotaxis protein methyltransferase WspC
MPTAIDKILPEVSRLLAERAGMAAPSLGDSLITHAIRKCIAASGADTPQVYLRRLLTNADDFQELLDEVLVPETWFFRDQLAFRGLTSCLETGRFSTRETVRILSAGCSTGEEVYTLAIVLREAGFSPGQFTILGTDAGRRGLDFARTGAYSSRSFRETDPGVTAACDRWHLPDGEDRRVRDELRAGIEFRWANLAQLDFLAGEQPFDVIFCRNVLIYFHEAARRLAVRNMRRLLHPEGVLFSAAAEARIFVEAGFRGMGNECPSAFQCSDDSSGETVEVQAAARLQAGTPAKPKNSEAITKARSASEESAFPLHQRTFLADRDHGYMVPDMVPASGFNDWNAKTPQGALGLDILLAAEQAANDGHLEEADLLCGQVLAEDPASVGAHYLRGVVRQSQGILIEAQRSFEKALYLEPKHYQALVHMMLLADQRGDARAAANYRRRAQQAAPPEAT